MAQAVTLALTALLPSAGFAQGGPTKPVEFIRVSGRAINAAGRPLSNVDLRLVSLDPLDKTAPIMSVSQYDGLFLFSVVRPMKYKFLVPGGEFKIVPSTIEIPAGADINLGDVVVQPDVKSDLQPEQIIVDPLKVENGVEMMGGGLSPSSHQVGPPCGLESRGNYQTVEAFLGGKVKTIRAVRVLAGRGSAPAEVRSRIMDVWLGVFGLASCAMMWSEMTRWNLEASVEYEDGSLGTILTDGVHVALQDRKGRVWYIRLWPAAN